MTAVLLAIAGAAVFLAGFWLGALLIADLFTQADLNDRAEGLR